MSDEKLLANRKYNRVYMFTPISCSRNLLAAAVAILRKFYTANEVIKNRDRYRKREGSKGRSVEKREKRVPTV